MKINKIKKIFSVIILILMLFNIVQPVLAASGSGVWTGGQYASGMKTTDNQNGTTGLLLENLSIQVMEIKKQSFAQNMV